MITNNNMNNLITIFAIVAVAVAVINLSVTFIKVSDFKEKMTGYATGYVNLTINTYIAVNLTQSFVNFSIGSVDPLATSATLQTNGASAATITNGNWSTTAEPLIIMNIGNINASLNLTAGNNATNLLGNVTTVAPVYQWNVTNKEAGSCHGGNVSLTSFADANRSTRRYCKQFSSLSGSNELYVDVKLVVPYDGLTGALSDTITITASTAITD